MLPTPLIPDGVYKIRNGEFTNSVVDLLYGNPNGEIVGHHDSGSPDNKWMIQNVGNGGNQVYIQSRAAPGTYAHAYRPGGGRIVPSMEKTLWTVVKVDGGMYYLQTEDGQRVWELPGGVDNVPIFLVPHTGQPNTKWRFEPQIL